ncbi:tight adherence pilus pseudopilin TadF [Vibrio owensii]|uniref:tight adherence pilus pseudopilin TadF n=1 Tax=Vibrio owensii TaxID=696485 RepID=UPI00374A6F9D
MINLNSKHQGTFSVEFGLLVAVFSLMLIFTADMVVKLSVQGKLDRLSYSLVNVIKERTQLYGKDNFFIDEGIVSDVYAIALSSLKRTMGSFEENKIGGEFELLHFAPDGKADVTKINMGTGCVLSSSIEQQQDLSMVTSWGRRATLYKVTLCYETDNWSGKLLDKEFSTIQSSSIMMGR